jgi:hypothetical protein
MKENLLQFYLWCVLYDVICIIYIVLFTNTGWGWLVSWSASGYLLVVVCHICFYCCMDSFQTIGWSICFDNWHIRYPGLWTWFSSCNWIYLNKVISYKLLSPYGYTRTEWHQRDCSDQSAVALTVAQVILNFPLYTYNWFCFYHPPYTHAAYCWLDVILREISSWLQWFPEHH